jgi:GWxTD domain-containing protein
MIRWLALAFLPAVLVAQQDTAFSTASEAKLDSLYSPLVYLMKADERGRYGSLGVEGKRAFLRQFWKRRDPTPDTPANETMTSYYGRVATVNRMFREGGAAEIPGWRTDRGRIYLKYGPPSAVLNRPRPPSANPYEVWRYEKGRLLKFVFLDLTRFGNYALVWTNDLAETVRPDWYVLLGPEAVEDAMRF